MRINRLAWVLALVVASAAAPAAPAEKPPANDDLGFRATVIVRRGDGQGSGTVIASVPGETLVLTASHVVHGAGPVVVEVHRYNLGLERTRESAGWPAALLGEVAADDPSGDVAVVRIRGKEAMPFVARLTAPGDEPGLRSVVTSIGVDGGSKLECWTTRVLDVSWFSMGPEPAQPTGRSTRRTFSPRRPRARLFDATVRPFLITEKAPVPGRSGGGLFLADGRLSGVCVGRIEGAHGRASGLFAAPQSIRLLLLDHDLDQPVARSEAAHARQAR